MAKKTSRKVTRNDVAQLAGVSTAVVSYVVNGGPREVAPDTREKVQAAIDKLGYLPNAAARSLMTGRSNMLALVVPDVTNPYFAQIAQEVEIAARENGRSLLLVQAPDDHHEVISSLNRTLVDGIICAVILESTVMAELLRRGLPIVQLSINTFPSPAAALQPDYYAGARLAVEHLVTHGHQKIACLDGYHRDGMRFRGWRDSLLAQGLQPGPVVNMPWSRQGGFDGVGELLSTGQDFSAVFVVSDQMASGALAAFSQRGIRVPDQVAMVSFDATAIAEFMVPPLTTVGVPIKQMARDAVMQLITAHPQRSGSDYVAQLYIRRSCGCA